MWSLFLNWHNLDHVASLSENMKTWSGILLLAAIFCNVYVINSNDVTDSINKFAIDLYKELIKKQSNLVCSPFSLSIALSTLLVGARNHTALEIKKTLHLDVTKLTEEQVENTFHDILKQQKNAHPGYEIKVVNTVWIQEGLNVLSDFKNSIDKIFFSVGKSIQFKNSKANDIINRWINEATNGKIKRFFDEPLNPRSSLVLTSAVYFNGTWEQEFEEAHVQEFTANVNGKLKSKKVPMMDASREYPYADNSELNAQILELPYKGKEVSMFVLLPKEEDGLEDMEKKLTLEIFDEAVGEMEETEVSVKLPKFNLSSSLNLSPTLQALGIKEVFVDGMADLSGITKQENLDLSKVVQKAMIDVDEKGTVASAATGAVFLPYSATSMDKVLFIANHPFMFLIRHKNTGIVLFVGRIQDL